MLRVKFKFRAFTALIMLWSFILETVSGIVLYVVPPGRIAHWTNWKLWGMTKEEWAAVHTILGYVFLIFAVIHIIYNWRPILNYIRKKIHSGLRARRELAVSLLLTLVVTAATLVGIPPFSTIMDFGESLRYAWEESRSEPFMAHAELLRFDEFVTEIGIPLERAREILSGKGIEIQDPALTVKDVAEAGRVSPSGIYEIILSGLAPEEREDMPKQKPAAGAAAGGGYGWKTLREIGQDLQIPLQEIMEFLKSKGISAEPDEVVRDVAEKHGIKAFELVRELRERKD